MDQPPPSSDTVDFARVARLVRPFETLELRAVRRPGGGWSIGYGHVRSAREGAQVTREEAAALLLYDLRHVAQRVRSAIYAPIHRNQLEALIAFAFHIGTDSFLNSTTLQRFNAGDSLGAAQELERWCRADVGGDVQVVDALVRRRAAEKAHFLTPPQGFPKASRARLQPRFEVAPSAALTAAHNVAARLRALVPDVADQAELQPSTFAPEPKPEPELQLEPEIQPELDLDPASQAHPAVTRPVAEIVAGPQNADLEAEAAASVPLEAVAPPEAEVPPPPFEASGSAGRHDVTPVAAAMSTPPNPAAYDVWPSFTPAEVRPGDPFADGPSDGAAFEAPPRDEPATPSSLFRARPQPPIPPRSENAGEASVNRTPRAGVPRSLLFACLAAGLAIFLGSIWSIFKTSPDLVNFAFGLVGIAVMAAPAYVLLGAGRR